MQTATLHQEPQQHAKMNIELVKQGLVQYLTLSVKSNGIDQEELEWSLLMVAQELQKSLKMRGVKWEIAPFQRITPLNECDKKLDFHCKLLIPLPEQVTWNEYDKAIKKALELRRDFWVVQIRLERIVEGWCLKYSHRGSRNEMQALVIEMKAKASKDNLRMGNYFHELVVNDEEKVAESALETIILIPVEI